MIHQRRVGVALVLVAMMVGSIVQAATEANERSQLADSLSEFVKSEFVHGVPYDQARAFGEESLPYLRIWLDNGDFKPHWANIVLIIGYIGSPSDFAALRHFIFDRFTGEVDSETVQAIVAAMHGLAFIATQSNEAMDFLVAATNPAYFKGLTWTSGGYRRGLKLSEFAINAISLTGRPEAEEILTSLETKPFDATQIPNIREGLSRYRETMRLGRDEYFRSTQVGTAE